MESTAHLYMRARHKGKHIHKNSLRAASRYGYSNITNRWGCCPQQFVTSLIPPYRHYSTALGERQGAITEVDSILPLFGHSRSV